MTVGIARCRNKLHELVPTNVRVSPKGHWICRTCSCAAHRRDYLKHKEEHNARSRRYYREVEKPQRHARNMAKFGLTPADYDRMLVEQGGGCAICGSDQAAGRWNTRFHVDHDHLTGQVRGLLCGHCNVMLGNAGDDPSRLRAAAAYLDGALSPVAR